ncbi:putative S-adenosylmethionine decarboxylase [Heterosigma akashiwo virus 01]|uniref:Putative S-adenosylmethionine decarboxylase n=1 Tax=Heterosigma akashiwo virus 01 TaxID=97195 RepID=A0A1C9C535_HAV01|nr:S-adenosylmethionine decarboxylase [Heterosigma akashiwo virus 01]AOM63397.1 putative S-adenosylmethionine decarboxylase [Heterosigma akashiwo virus 01]
MQKNYNGTHLIFDINTSEDNIIALNAEYGQRFLESWVEFNKHTIMHPPVIVNFPNNVENIEQGTGYTAFIVLAESHVSIHTYPEMSFISVDFFSCKCLDLETNKAFIDSYFNHKLNYKRILKIDRSMN